MGKPIATMRLSMDTPITLGDLVRMADLVGVDMRIEVKPKRKRKAAAARRKRLLPKKRTPEAIERAVQAEVAEARRKRAKGGKRHA